MIVYFMLYSLIYIISSSIKNSDDGVEEEYMNKDNKKLKKLCIFGAKFYLICAKLDKIVGG